MTQWQIAGRVSLQLSASSCYITEDAAASTVSTLYVSWFTLTAPVWIRDHT